MVPLARADASGRFRKRPGRALPVRDEIAMGITVGEIASPEILVGILADLEGEHRNLMRLAIECSATLDRLSSSQLACAVHVHRWAVEEGLINFDGDPDAPAEGDRSRAVTGMESLGALATRFHGEPDGEEVVEHLLAWLDAGYLDPDDFEGSLSDHLDLLSLTGL